MLASDWQNPANWLDVNDDGVLAPVDALIVINRINSEGSGPLPDLSGPRPTWYLDTDGDLQVAPIDMLLVINGLEDDEAPVIQASLARDTAPSGATNSDAVTFDPTIAGTFTDQTGVVSLDILEATGLGVKSSVLIDRSGQFSFAPDLAVSGAIDAGDYYLSGGEKVQLLRIPGEIVFGTVPGADANTLQTELTAEGGTLSGFSTALSLDQSTRSFVRTASAEDNLAHVADVLQTNSNIAWAGPTFIDAQSGTRLWATDEIIVALQRDTDPVGFFGNGLPQYRRLRGILDQYVLSVSGGTPATLGVAAWLNSRPEVDWASPNFIREYHKASVPIDDLYPQQWHLNNTGQTGAPASADARLEEAWDTTTGSESIVIAVIDDGVQTSHPDLNIFINADEIPGNGIDDDGNEYSDDVNGWDFFDNDRDPNPADNDNHGTAVAGVAGAIGNNQIGVTGAAQRVQILPVKLLKDGLLPRDQSGVVDDAKVAEAIYDAAGVNDRCEQTWRGADIIIYISWYNPQSTPASETALDKAATCGLAGLGTAIFAASGNSAREFATYSFLTSDLPDGTYALEFEYYKDSAGTAGDDTVWLGSITFPDAARTRFHFDAPQFPTGWDSSPYGEPAWTVVDDPLRATGVGSLIARAGRVSDGPKTTLRTNTFTLSPGQNLSFDAWVSSERGTDGDVSYPPNGNDGDWLVIWFYNVSTNQYAGGYVVDAGTPGDRRRVSGVQDVRFPARFASTIAVGASTDWDYRANYSQHGSDLDFVAPSSGGFAGITTTDRTGTAGYNTDSGTAGDYTSTFSATSSATPLAAGIGALLLSKNPNLTATGIRDKMRVTADEIGGVEYSNAG